MWYISRSVSISAVEVMVASILLFFRKLWKASSLRDARYRYGAFWDRGSVSTHAVSVWRHSSTSRQMAAFSSCSSEKDFLLKVSV